MSEGHLSVATPLRDKVPLPPETINPALCITYVYLCPHLRVGFLGWAPDMKLLIAGNPVLLVHVQTLP